MSHTDMGIVGATTDSFILFENGVRRNRLVLRRRCPFSSNLSCWILAAIGSTERVSLGSSSSALVQLVRWITRRSVGRIVIRPVGITNYAYVAGAHNSDMATGVTADQRSALRASTDMPRNPAAFHGSSVFPQTRSRACVSQPDAAQWKYLRVSAASSALHLPIRSLPAVRRPNAGIADRKILCVARDEQHGVHLCRCPDHRVG